MRTINGAFLISRSIYDSGIWTKPAEWLKIWLYLLWNVNWQDNNLFKRWENFFKYEVIAVSCDVSINTVNKCIKYLIVAEQIHNRKTSRWAIISINNFDKYQDMWNYGRTEAEQKQNRSRTGTNTITEEGKKERNKRNNTYTESFEIFWKEYPNRVGKPDAMKKYKKQEHSDIMDWLERWKEFWDYSETEPRFIPHPATWLNQERYKDNPPETKPKTISVINKF